MNLIEKATEFATKAHEGQVRKVRKNPFIEHPVGVGNILKEAGLADEVVAAGILHDVVEDTEYTMDDIRNEFGESVAALVASNTEQKLEEDGSKRAWKKRKLDTINGIATKTFEEKALLIADKLDNLRSLLHDAEVVEKHGGNINDYFTKSIENQIWYYSTIKEKVFESINPNEEVPNFFHEYEKFVSQFINDYN